MDKGYIVTDNCGEIVESRIFESWEEALKEGLHELKRDITSEIDMQMLEARQGNIRDLIALEEVQEQLMGAIKAEWQADNYIKNLERGVVFNQDQAHQLLKEWGYAIHSTNKGKFHVERF